MGVGGYREVWDKANKVQVMDEDDGNPWHYWSVWTCCYSISRCVPGSGFITWHTRWDNSEQVTVINPHLLFQFPPQFSSSSGRCILNVLRHILSLSHTPQLLLFQHSVPRAMFQTLQEFSYSRSKTLVLAPGKWFEKSCNFPDMSVFGVFNACTFEHWDTTNVDCFSSVSSTQIPQIRGEVRKPIESGNI